MELTEMITSQGILVVIAGIFLTTFMDDRKYRRKQDAQINEVLTSTNKALDTTNRSLELLKQTTETLVSGYRLHDERSIEIKDAMIEIRTICKDRRNSK